VEDEGALFWQKSDIQGTLWGRREKVDQSSVTDPEQHSG